MTTLMKGISRLQVEALSRQLGEPDWMRNFRLSAWDIYEGLELPGATDETWRRIDLRGLDLDSVNPEGAAALPATAPEAWQEVMADEKNHVIILRNGRPVFSRLPAEAVAQGLLVLDLETAIRDHSSLVQRHLMTTAVKPDENIFMALHAALMRGGVFVYVPSGLEVLEPISILTWADAAGPGFLGHTLVVAEANSSISLVEESHSPDQPQPVVQLGAVEIVPMTGAKVKYASVQNWGANVWSFTVRRAHVGPDSHVDWLAVELGGELVRSENYSWFEHEGGAADFKLLFLGSDRQRFDVTATAEHAASHTSSNILGRGVNAGHSRSVFRGLCHIRRGAAQCSTYQRQNTLMLSQDARADAIPGLLVEFDDVAGAGHAATTGQVDPQMIFYLNSRGIPTPVAKSLIVHGFMAPVLERVTVRPLQQSLRQLIDRKMG